MQASFSVPTGVTIPTPVRAASDIYPSASLLLAAEPGREERELANRDLTITPLGICINIPTLPPEAKLEARHHNLLGALQREIKLYAGRYGSRPITQLMWRNPYELMEPAEVTNVMHHLSSQFHLSTDTCREYCAEINLLTATEEHIALLRGLGFNQLLIRLMPDLDHAEEEQTAAKLEHRMQCLRDYGFECLGIKLVYRLEGPTACSVPKVIDLVSRLHPDRVVLCDICENYQWDKHEPWQQLAGQNSGASPLVGANAQIPFALHYKALCQAGYRVIGNDCFVKPRDALARAQNDRRLRRTVLNYNASNTADILGLGPGAYSQLGRHYRHNSPEIATYIYLLGEGKLPVSSRLTLDRQGHLLLLLIDQLLCFHRLNVTYLEARYNISLTSILATAFDRLREVQTRHPSLLHFGGDGGIYLTPEGIFYLRHVCETLISLSINGKLIFNKTD